MNDDDLSESYYSINVLVIIRSAGDRLQYY